MTLLWSADLDTGIEAIDEQHRRLVDFINDLEVELVLKNVERIEKAVENCIAYTRSHFSFEEDLQQEAGYPYCKPHKKVHDLFMRKAVDYQQRIAAGQDLAEELHELFATWLVKHIKQEDANYVRAIRVEPEADLESSESDAKAAGWLRRFFG